MEKSILSEELNAMKYLLGYKRGVVISEQQVPTFGNPNQFSTNPFAPNTQAPNTQTAADIYNEFQRQQGPAAQIYKDFQAKYGQQVPATGTTAAPVTAAPTTGTTAAPVTAAPTTGTTVAAAPATNVSMPDLIKQIQTILKTKFNATLGTSGPNKDGIDGVWGKNSQTAFENALKTLSTQPAAAAPTSGTPAPAAGAPVSGATSTTQQKFNFNPNPNLNLNPESGINFKPSTPKL
jgi:hypothetical protein